jgi:DNA-binding protein YbaB
VEASPAANAALRARLDELLGEYDRVRKNLTSAQSRMQSMTGTAETSDHAIKVTVDFRGNLTGLELAPRAYSRYSPTLLAEQILRLVKEASEQVTTEMAEVMAPFLPKGVSYADLVSGAADPSAVAFEKPLTNDSFDEWRARFGGRPVADPEQSGR